MKFSIVTPSYNSEKFIAETIESVISQKGQFEIEYLLIDGLSTDKTVDIIEKYIHLVERGFYPLKCKSVLMRFVSEKDTGMYDAINKGFSIATGDIFAWINADDIYLSGAFNVIARTFEKYKQVIWLKGISSYIDDKSVFYEAGEAYLYTQEWIQKGIYGRYRDFIQQDSVFWRSELWRKVGGINPILKRAGDYSLWTSFSQITSLYSLKVFLSCFRKVEGQLSKDINLYNQEMEQICPVERIQGRVIEYYFRYESFFPRLVRPVFYRLLFGNHPYHVIALDNQGSPNLISGSYYELKG